MNIGSKIKQLRLKSGLTQEQLASRLNLSAQSISKWETGITLPDITLLPLLSGELGVSIDELFDLTTEQKLQRIEKRIEMEEEFSNETFVKYEAFLKMQLEETRDERKILSLLAHLYHHRMESDARKVSKYARRAIMLAPEVKECQWLLQKAEGATVWDWNCANHTELIKFYKQVIENDTVAPGTPLPYYELVDHLIADHRTKEAKEYLERCERLPACRPFLIPVYKAHIALAEYDAATADEIMENALRDFGDNSGFLFEMAQYHAHKCEYEAAIECYERSWKLEEDQKPRFTDALQGIATIYEILSDHEKASQTYDRWIACLTDEWGYRGEDAAIAYVTNKKVKLPN